MTDVIIDGVTFTYESADEPALRDVSCAIEAGSFVGVTGPADAGKTTFCRLFSGFVPDFFGGDFAGSVTVGKTDTRDTDIATLGTTVGYVFENPFDQLTGAATTVLEEVAFGLEQRGVPSDELEARARDELARVDIAMLAERDPSTLSGGQLQRVAIASVLALEPEVLVLDEPTSQLDPDGTEAVFDVVSRLGDGYTVILVSHDLQRLAPRSDRLLVFEDGRLTHDDPPRTVLSNRLEDTVRVPPTIHIGRALRNRGVVPADHPLSLTVAEIVEGITHADVTIPSEDHITDGNGDSEDDGSGNGNRDADECGNSRVRLDDACHVYDGGIEALQGIDLTMDDGCVAVLGHNGAGKTTLAKHLNGLLEPTTGRVLIRGTDTRTVRVSDLASDVGLAFQDPDDQLFRSTVASEIRFGPENVSNEDRAVQELVDRALERMALNEVRNTDTYELGRSVRKRVALASVLAMDTPVVVLDEPTGGQDATGVSIIGEAISDLVADGYLVVCITHDVAFAREHADRVVALSEGRVIAHGTPRAVFTDEATMDETGLQAPIVTQVGAALDISVVSVAELLARLA